MEVNDLASPLSLPFLGQENTYSSLEVDSKVALSNSTPSLGWLELSILDNKTNADDNVTEPLKPLSFVNPESLLSVNSLEQINDYSVSGSSGDLLTRNNQLELLNTNSLVFIDPTLADYSSLINSVSDAEVVILDPNQDGIAQITNVLEKQSNISSLHLVSHGDAGTLQLGSRTLSLNTLDRYRNSLQNWSTALTETADILIYGCNVGAGTEGQSFVQKLSNLTAADIAASDDLTGNSSLGGDWRLEVTTGAIEAASAFQPLALETYNAVFHSPSVLINPGGGNYTDNTGHVWKADTSFSGGKNYWTTTAIAGTDNDALYQTERFGKNFSYNLAVDNGLYQVNLEFAEIYWDEAGKRIFDVQAEKQTVIDNLDIFAEVGKNTALTKTIQIDVTDGTLNLDFSTIVDHAKVSAIEVMALRDSNTDTTPPLATLKAGNLNSGESLYTYLTVTYADDSGIDVSTFDQNDLVITGPNGSLPSIFSTSVNESGNGSSRTATYAVDAPGERWDETDNGTYTISLKAGEVSDLEGNSVATDTKLGSFDVNITPNTTASIDFSDYRLVDVSGKPRQVLVEATRGNLTGTSFVFDATGTGGLLPHFHKPGNPTFITQHNGADNGQQINFTMARQDGEAFALEGFSYTSGAHIPNGELANAGFTVVGTTAEGEQVAQNFNSAATPGVFQPVTLNGTGWNNVVSVRFIGDRLSTETTSDNNLVLTQSLNLDNFIVSAAAPPAPMTVYLVNAGGNNYTDGKAQVWTADTFFSGGKTYSTSAPIASTNNDKLYQTERFGQNFSYSLAVDSDRYQVNLEFAEIYWDEAGKRIFDVQAEGQLVIDDLDIFAEVGKNAALTKTIEVDVTDGTLNLDFSTLADHAKVSAIEVIALGGSVSNTNTAPTTTGIANVTASENAPNTVIDLYAAFNDVEDTDADLAYLLYSNSNASLFSAVTIDDITGKLTLDYAPNATGSAFLTVQATDTGGLSTATTFKVVVNAVSDSDPTDLINIGGKIYTNSLGQTWIADNYFSGGKTYSTNAAIAGTSDDKLYQSERFGNFSYKIPVANGNYEVDLEFAEIYWDAPNQRIFDVAAEGKLVLDDLDIWSEVGKNAALTKQLSIEVTDGMLNLDFLTVVDQAKVSAIRVKPYESNSHVGHPFLHVVIDAPKSMIDYDGNGSETVRLLGAESHTHEFGHKLVGWTWQNNGNVIGAMDNIESTLGLGKQQVSLTITDDNTLPETLTDSVYVDVFPINAVGGVLTKYYSGISSLDTPLPSSPKFIEVLPSLTIEETDGTIGTSPFFEDVVAVMSGDLAVTVDGTYNFSVNGDTESQLYLNSSLVSGPISLAAGTTYSLEARIARHAAATEPIEILASIDGAAAAPLNFASLTHNRANLLPFINKMPSTGSELGGQTATLEGIGFFEGDASHSVKVHWGNTLLTGAALDISQGAITLMTPPGTGTVQVKVETPNGVSNPVTYIYNGAKVPIDFTAAAAIATVGAPTQGTWGPDGRFYVGSITGEINIYTFNENYQVINTQTVNTLQGLNNNNILGIAFSPFDESNAPSIYVAHSQLFANGGAGIPDGSFSPYSGQVSVLEGPNFSELTPLITGLPVSNHDHGINGMTFDNKGNLLIAVGGNTNAGIPDAKIGDLPESPLAAAILKANLNDSDFNGTIQYKLTAGEIAPTGFDPNNQVYGDLVDVISDLDVSVYASGFRNPFDLVWTASGLLYGTDNGPNNGYGDASTSATTQAPDPSNPDEINLILAGNYYGHPNRNRGRYDDRQNVYHGPKDLEIPGVYMGPLTTVSASTNGIDEYRSMAFNGQMRGTLLAQKWKGQLYSFNLSSDGKAIQTTNTFTNVANGLDVVTGPGGAILGIDYSGNQITLSQPNDIGAVGVTAYDIFPWRAPASGGNTFILGGDNFGNLTDTTVLIGGQQAILTKVTETWIYGILPNLSTASSEFQDIVVTSGGQSSIIPDGFLPLFSGHQPVLNTAPTSSRINNVIVSENAANTVINLSDVFDDAEDNSALTYSVTVSNSSLFDTVTIDQQTGKLTLDYAANVLGNAELAVKAIDSQGLSVETPLAVTVVSAQNTGSEAFFSIKPSDTNIITSSTYSSGSFKITNTSTSGQKIDRVLVDLSSSMLQDMVFDPYGKAGDTVAKGFKVDSNDNVGQIAHRFLRPHDEGFDALEITFTDFDPGETMTFSLDIDPTSTKGMPAPGPGDSASVSGLELMGTQVTVAFDDGTLRAAETYRSLNSNVGSEVAIKAGGLNAPILEVLGISSTQSTVTNANQTVRIYGPAGAAVTLLVLEAAMFTDNGSAFDIDAFEANTALDVKEQSVAIGNQGYVDIPVTLTHSHSDGGLNHLVAVFKDAIGNTSLMSPMLVLQLLS